MCQYSPVDAGDFFNEIGEDTFGPDSFPVFGEEDDSAGSDELLQGPTALVPLASPEGRGDFARVLLSQIRDVIEEGVAHGGALVPSVHGVDGF